VCSFEIFIVYFVIVGTNINSNIGGIEISIPGYGVNTSRVLH